MNPPDRNDWVILYKIEGAKQRFISNTNAKKNTVKVGSKEVEVASFEFTLPADAKAGMYRVTYRQEAGGFVDLLFNKEDIEFSFNPDVPEQTVSFSKSDENKTFNEFLQANALTQKAVDSLQMSYLKAPSEKIKKMYPKSLEKVKDVYDIYDKKSKGMLANHFIKAMQRDNAKEIASDAQNYFSQIADNFFNHIDFDSKELYNSSFLIDRITDYVFYLNYSAEPALQEKLYTEATDKVMGKINNPKLKKENRRIFNFSIFERSKR